jgi:hypothetical protein
MKPFVLAILFGVVSLQADDTQAVLDRVKSMREDAAMIQQRIDGLDDETRALYEAYRESTRELEAQRAYNDQLEKLHDSQVGEIESLEAQIAGIEETSRRVMPLMAQMVETLERLIELDRPFLEKERSAQVAQLKEALYRADATVAERYRLILEAYQDEMAYGRTIESWRGELSDGRAVDFFRLGRIGLYYQTLDGRESGRYDAVSGRYEPMDRRHRQALSEAIAIASQEAVPELIVLPLEPPKKAAQ